jgi:predicted O-methyltransferase YrrM
MGRSIVIEHYSDSIPGQFTFKQFYMWLVGDVMGRTPTPHIVEVGTFRGQSAAFLAVELCNRCPGARLDLVDFSQANLNAVAMNLERVSSVIGRVHRGISWEVASYYTDNSLDCVFIDADHSYDAVSKDIGAWLPKVKRGGGILAGHDYNWQFPGVLRAVSERFERCEVFRGELFTAADGSKDYYSSWMVRA